MTHFAITIDLPYNPTEFTKNRAHVLRKAPKTKLGVAVGRSDSARAVMDKITYAVIDAKNKSRTQPHKCRTALRIVVFKSTWQSDAINVLDLLADGIKVGLNIDDTWFYIAKLDWMMVPSGKEHLQVTICQDEMDDCWWCSVCRAYSYKRDLDSKGRCINCMPSKTVKKG